MMPNSMKESVRHDYELPEPPDHYSYETVQFKRNIDAIWLLCHHKFLYNSGAQSRTIWGFYNTKTRKYYAPINSKTIGKEVSIEDTTPYTSMPINRNPLSQLLYGTTN